MDIERKKFIEGGHEEKEAAWNKKLQEIEGYKDQAGNAMDEGMKEVVTALNVNGIPTIQSCAGHLEKYMLPWVQIGAPGRPEGVYQKSDITPEWENWKKQEDDLKKQVGQLLEDFSSSREAGSAITLGLNISNQIGAVSKEIQETEANDPLGLKPLTKDEKTALARLIPLAQEEMSAFANFLKRKFFEEQKKHI